MLMKPSRDDNERLDQAVSDLTVLVDSRDWSSLSGHADLVASLMAILSHLLSKRQSISQGTDYLEQEVLAAILVLVEKIQVGSQ